jgi:hypothetical protein
MALSETIARCPEGFDLALRATASRSSLFGVSMTMASKPGGS